jgi:hypothetical protein
MRHACRFIRVLGSLALVVLSAVNLRAAGYQANEIPPPSQHTEELLDAQRANERAQAEYYRLQTKKLQERPPDQSFWKNAAANPAATLGAFGAVVAALVTITTFLFNYRSTIRTQRDTQFYEALKRFGDKDSPVIRASAAGLLGQMALLQTGFRHPYFSTVFDQLSLGLILEQDELVREANRRAVQRLITVDAPSVIAGLLESNIRHQDDLIHILAKRVALRNGSPWESPPWESLAGATGYEIAVLQALKTARNRAFRKALIAASRRCRELPEAARQELIDDKQLRFKALVLQENCSLLQSIAAQVLPRVHINREMRRGDYVVDYVPERRRSSPRLILTGAFLPGFNISDRFIRKAGL